MMFVGIDYKLVLDRIHCYKYNHKDFNMQIVLQAKNTAQGLSTKAIKPLEVKKYNYKQKCKNYQYKQNKLKLR